MDRVRAIGPNGGYDMSDAKAWQRRVYSGIVGLTPTLCSESIAHSCDQVNLAEMLPPEIGAAAAYEAYRMWKHHRGILFDPLGGSVDRERDGLIGLAIGEGMTLGHPVTTDFI